MSYLEEFIISEVRARPIIYDKRYRRDPNYDMLANYAFEEIVTEIQKKINLLIPVASVKKIWDNRVAEARALFLQQQSKPTGENSKNQQSKASSIRKNMDFMKDHLSLRDPLTTPLTVAPSKAAKKTKKRFSAPKPDNFAAKKLKRDEDLLSEMKSVKDLLLQRQATLDVPKVRSNYFTVLFDLMRKVSIKERDACFDSALEVLDEVENN